MAKTLNVRTTLYDVTANVVVKSDSGIEIVEFSGEGSATKSMRALQKSILASYENEGLTVLAIDGITTAKRVETVSYTVNADMQAIVDACIAAGLDVKKNEKPVTDSDTENEEK